VSQEAVEVFIRVFKRVLVDAVVGNVVSAGAEIVSLRGGEKEERLAWRVQGRKQWLVETNAAALLTQTWLLRPLRRFRACACRSSRQPEAARGSDGRRRCKMRPKITCGLTSQSTSDLPVQVLG
jgi:hypothetical protein